MDVHWHVRRDLSVFLFRFNFKGFHEVLTFFRGDRTVTSAYQRLNLPPDGLVTVKLPIETAINDAITFGTTIDIENQTINFYCDGIISEKSFMKA